MLRWINGNNLISSFLGEFSLVLSVEFFFYLITFIFFFFFLTFITKNIKRVHLIKCKDVIKLNARDATSSMTVKKTTN